MGLDQRSPFMQVPGGFGGAQDYHRGGVCRGQEEVRQEARSPPSLHGQVLSPHEDYGGKHVPPAGLLLLDAILCGTLVHGGPPGAKSPTHSAGGLSGDRFRVCAPTYAEIGRRATHSPEGLVVHEHSHAGGQA